MENLQNGFKRRLFITPCLKSELHHPRSQRFLLLLDLQKRKPVRGKSGKLAFPEYPDFSEGVFRFLVKLSNFVISSARYQLLDPKLVEFGKNFVEIGQKLTKLEG